MRARRLLAIAPAWPLAIAIVASPTPAFARLLLLATFAISTWRPSEGLLLLAGLAPLGLLLGDQFDILLRLTEALVLAFLAGWLLHDPDRRAGPRVPRSAAIAGWLFAWLLLLSVVMVAFDLARNGGLAPTLRQLAWNYLYLPDRVGASDAAKLLEGFALAAAAVELVRRRPILADHLPVALAASTVAAAGSSVLLWTHLAPAEVLARYGQIGYRVAAHVPDVNAAGSFFAMMLCVSLGVAARERRPARVGWASAAAAAAAGLWLSGSRSAEWSVVGVVIIALGWLWTRRWTARSRRIAVAIIALGALAIGASRAYRLARDPEYVGARMRTQFVETSARMIAERPVFGVGIGQYLPTSRLFMPAALAWSYGVENAHNYFLQVTAETGGIGVLLWATFVGGLSWRGWRGVAANERDYRLLGAAAGVIVFLSTCLTGHPLLVSEVAVPFWIVIGLAAALGGSNLSRIEPERSARGRLAAATALTGMVLLTSAVPLHLARPRMTPPRALAVTGRHPPEFDQTGAVIEWTGPFASVFVPASWSAVELPVRPPAAALAAGSVGVGLSTGAPGQAYVTLGDFWSFPLVDLTDAPQAGGLKRIDLRPNRMTRLSDGREVGVAIQQPREWRSPAK